MTIVEILKAARARVAEGWCQGRYELADASGKPIAWCAAGAISRQKGVGLAGLSAAYDALRDAIGSGRPVFSVSHWNDETGRTQADVLGLYDRAIGIAAVRE